MDDYIPEKCCSFSPESCRKRNFWLENGRECIFSGKKRHGPAGPRCPRLGMLLGIQIA
jgi:hypothetical protein